MGLAIMVLASLMVIPGMMVIVLREVEEDGYSVQSPLLYVLNFESRFGRGFRKTMMDQQK